MLKTVRFLLYFIKTLIYRSLTASSVLFLSLSVCRSLSAHSFLSTPLHLCFFLVYFFLFSLSLTHFHPILRVTPLPSLFPLLMKMLHAHIYHQIFSSLLIQHSSSYAFDYNNFLSRRVRLPVSFSRAHSFGVLLLLLLCCMHPGI